MKTNPKRTPRQRRVKKLRVWGLLYSVERGGFCHYDGAFNDMPSIYFKRRTALYHAGKSKELVVPVTISYLTPKRVKK